MSDASETGQLDSIGARLTALPAAVDGDPGLLRRGRWLNATCQLESATPPEPVLAEIVGRG
jgi:hypothetical protein